MSCWLFLWSHLLSSFALWSFVSTQHKFFLKSRFKSAWDKQHVFSGGGTVQSQKVYIRREIISFSMTRREPNSWLFPLENRHFGIIIWLNCHFTAGWCIMVTLAVSLKKVANKSLNEYVVIPEKSLLSAELIWLLNWFELCQEKHSCSGAETLPVLLKQKTFLV